ncbi:sigma-70 family RNA polymerase sigma factor [Gemmata sp. G18]|uniref:Sigma-70 family RNA polymerase sigma factor n=1 Tax=Gemmata palustris TaxID=2822762 RepID=A0ABS5BTV5_9BACT|nr:sigma-70 family RNA polymerase sigma factor [Gemmata palustris]MBP3957152.1 sigma-70 family RNA polymerase sigma factor [Gemmata palustris]
MIATPLALLRNLPDHARTADGKLLRRYAETGDESAFAELVRRNGPLVLRACRNVLRDPAHADDAFQVTFLLLARNAARLVESPSVAGWLHTVAVRSAGKIRRAEDRRRRRERPPRAPSADPSQEDTAWAEVRERIDAELARLPDEYRLPLLLCYVQELSYADAAQRLGCTLGTLRGRLERGREALRRRLGRFGFPAALVLAGSAAPTVGASLRNATLAAVRSAGSAPVRAAVAWVKWLIVAGIAASAVAGIGFAALRAPADPPKLDPAPPPVAVAPAAQTDVVGDPLPPGALARMGSSRFHHGSNIHRLTVSPDGKWVISYGSHTGYRVWELATGKEQVPVGMPANARFTGSRGQGRDVEQWEAAVAPAGKRVVAVVPDKKQPVTRVLDAVTGEEVAAVPASLRHVLTRPSHTSDREPELSPDGKWMLWTHTTFNNGAKKTVYLADLTEKNPTPGVFTEIVGRSLFGFVFSDDGKSVVMHFQDTYEVWDTDTRTAKLKVPVIPNGTWVGHAVISADGKNLAVVQPMADSFQLWNVATKKELAVTAERSRGLLNVRAFSPDGKRIASSNSAGPLQVWDVATGKKVRDYPGGHGAWGAAFTPDGKRIAVALMDDVAVLDLETGKKVHDFGGHGRSVGFVGFTRDGVLLSCAESGLVWNPRTGKKIGAFAGHPGGVYGVAASRDGRLIATTGLDQKLRLRDAATLAEISVADTKGLTGYDVEFTPDGKELAVRGDKPGIRVIDTATGQQVRVIASGETMNGLQLTPDGRHVVFVRSSDQSKVHVWDWTTDKEVLAFDAGKRTYSAPALSTDGRFVAVGGGDGFVRLYDLGTGKPVREFDTNRPGSAAHDENSVYAVAFSPDGRTLATGCIDGKVRVWELATGGERFSLDGHRGSVLALAYSPDGTLLASGSSDRSVVTWDATGAALSTDPKHRPKDAVSAWAQLSDRDAAAGFAAARYLADRPAEAVSLFAKHLRPVPATDPKTVAGLIEKLGSETFSEREAAEKELAKIGEGAADQLRTAATAAEAPEIRKRLSALLAPPGVTRGGDRLRLIRAVEVTESAGTPEARKLLGEWARGARGAELTESARAAQKRLIGIDPPKPR